MTDNSKDVTAQFARRIRSMTVDFEEDVSDEDAQKLVAAVSCLRGVQGVALHCEKRAVEVARPPVAAEPPRVVVEQDEGGRPKLVVLHTKTEQQRAACVTKLATLLEQAKSGRMRDVLIIGFEDNDVVTMSWTPQTNANGFVFVGALHTMASLMISRMKMKEGAP
jgi:cell division protein FtsX